MLPGIDCHVARRVMVNYWLDAAVARRLVPAPLTPQIVNGYAVAGICLIRLEHVRPRGIPAAFGMASENAAHRIAVWYPRENGRQPGVFIWRRETDSPLIRQLGGRLFPGKHNLAEFHVTESADGLDYHIRTEDRRADLRLRVRYSEEWGASALFRRFDDACDFFRAADGGFWCSLEEGSLDGGSFEVMPACSQRWEMSPLRVESADARFFRNPVHFPMGSVALDSAVLMRGIASQWVEVRDTPELAAASAL